MSHPKGLHGNPLLGTRPPPPFQPWTRPQSPSDFFSPPQHPSCGVLTLRSAKAHEASRGRSVATAFEESVVTLSKCAILAISPLSKFLSPPKICTTQDENILKRFLLFVQHCS